MGPALKVGLNEVERFSNFKFGAKTKLNGILNIETTDII
jgi:hypothetical protein